jgi:hypothetical protein
MEVLQGESNCRGPPALAIAGIPRQRAGRGGTSRCDATLVDSRLLRFKRLPMIGSCRSKTMKSERPTSARGRRPNGRKIRNRLESPTANIGRKI